MLQLSELYFASSNKHKFQETKKILESFGVKIKFYKIELEEIQSNSLSEVASKKVINAFEVLKKPVIIEDDGLFIDSLGNFPGVYSSYVFKTIGNKGILRLVSDTRAAKFVSNISFSEKNFSRNFPEKI